LIQIELESSFDFTLVTEDAYDYSEKGHESLRIQTKGKGALVEVNSKLEQEDESAIMVDPTCIYDKAAINKLIKELGYGKAKPKEFILFLATCMDALLDEVVEGSHMLTNEGSIVDIINEVDDPDADTGSD
jgi:hypothetical protein